MSCSISNKRKRPAEEEDVISDIASHSPLWRYVTTKKHRPSESLDSARSKDKIKRRYPNGDGRQFKTSSASYSCDQLYTCNLTLFIILNARLYNTFHIVRHIDSEHSIELCCPYHDSRVNYYELGRILNNIVSLPSHAYDFNTITSWEDHFVGALRLLHGKKISFPVSVKYLWIMHYKMTSWSLSNGTTRHPKLFIGHNAEAAWETDELPSTWQADQLSDAKSIFLIPKIILYIRERGSKPTSLDLSDEQALADHIRFQCEDFNLDPCLDLTPVTAQLAFEIIYACIQLDKGQQARDELERYFGGPLPLPEPNMSPDEIYTSFSRLRARACNPDNASQIFPRPLLTLFICCRAQAATLLEESCDRDWWRTAMDLFDAYLGENYDRGSYIQRVCARDLHNIRGKN
ncbi:hypothetical protein F5Y11DRAFT_313649 [Daldinia sp. FL1419]|nr:hypothetical protein F5Y11DRAFT_313649 [Daldinia sp. FL1419]